MRPSLWRKIPGGWSYVLRIFARRPEDDVDAELRFHFDERIGELTANGLSPDEARAHALEEFGDVNVVRNRLHEIHRRGALRRRRAAWWESFEQDLAYALRGIRRTPGFAAVIIATLALGIGANTAIFTVVNHVLLDPLPYPGGNRIVHLTANVAPGVSIPRNAILDAWRARAHSLAMIAGVEMDAVAVPDDIGQDTVHAFITASYLPMLGLRPALGRNFTPAEELPGAARVAMISYGLWQRG